MWSGGLVWWCKLDCDVEREKGVSSSVNMDKLMRVMFGELSIPMMML
jgi:hypothetical protein